MSSSIVNCKVQYIRPEYNNLEEWINDDKNVYIARAGVVFINKQRYPKNSSKFANPYKIGKDGTREEVIVKYKEYIIKKLENDKSLINELLSLKGKNLGCWCYPEICHGNILLELIDKYSSSEICDKIIENNNKILDNFDDTEFLKIVNIFNNY